MRTFAHTPSCSVTIGLCTLDSFDIFAGFDDFCAGNDFSGLAGGDTFGLVGGGREVMGDLVGLCLRGAICNKKHNEDTQTYIMD